MKTLKFKAYPEDGKEILKILESSAAKGSIELLYTRRPDAYDSYMKEAGVARVFVSKNENQTIGTCAQLIRNVYIGGKPCKAAYICGLKKDEKYSGNIGFGIDFVRGLKQDNVDFYFCSVLSDNEEAQRKFEKGNRLISISPLAEYRTYIINPKTSFSAENHSFTFRKATVNDTHSIIEFLNEQGKKKDLFPVIDSFDQFYNLKYDDFYLLTDKNVILSVAALWNQTPYKQYVVKKYRGLMKLAPMANSVLSRLGYIHLPKENVPLDFPMLSFFMCRDDNERYYRIFLNEIKKEISKSYNMFVIGVPCQHFASKIFKSIKNISFETKLYGITFPWSDQQYAKINSEKIYPECGLL